MTSRVKSNIVLIGMPGAGKSTVGVILAKHTAKHFVDTDLLIQTEEGRTLQEILDHEGYLTLRAIEERVLLTVDLKNTVIATGGSAAYSERAMEHLRGDGVIVFLHVEPATLRRRVQDYETRGIARHPDQSFADLFAERDRLYRTYADVTVDADASSAEEVVERILLAIR